MNFAEERASLIAKLSREIKDKRVLAAMAKIPRELFIPAERQYLAYEDGPLPIGYGQTISQPFIVALMTEALELTGIEKVLEVGTGSGYQSAILAQMAKLVITTERIPHLAETARQLLSTLGYNNIVVQSAGEELGWQNDAPYDAIIVTAGAPAIPPELVAQLAVGGRLVIPVGSEYVQELCRLIKLPQQNKVENLGGCRFVPLIGKGAWNKDNY